MDRRIHYQKMLLKSIIEQKKCTIISSDVSNAISKTSAKSYGLEHMLKTPDSIERKLKLGKDIKDAVRFTTISSEEDFVKNYISFKKIFKRKVIQRLPVRTTLKNTNQEK